MDTAVRPKVVEDPRVFDAQAEVFWLAFQALPRPAQWVVRERLALAEVFGFELARELASWQTAASEALLSFEATLNDQVPIHTVEALMGATRPRARRSARRTSTGWRRLCGACGGSGRRVILPPALP
jgi:hypothetical protein